MGMTSGAPPTPRTGRGGRAGSSCLPVQTFIGEVAGSLWQDSMGAAGSRVVPRRWFVPKRGFPLGGQAIRRSVIKPTREQARRLPPR